MPTMRRCVPAGSLALPFVALALIFAAEPARAGELSLASIFSDHMVLQRDKPVPVWGWAEPGDHVTVEFAGQRRSGKAGADGKWLVRLDPLTANAIPAALTVNSAKSGGPLAVADVLVGEVWLGSGQSNMAMQVARAAHFDREKAAANLPLVRMFREDSKGAAEPQQRATGSWAVCTPDTVGSFSATLFFFGREIHSALGVPVGLVNSSVGGTPIEAWIDLAAQQAVPALSPYLAMIERERAAFDREAVRKKHEQAVAAWEEKARAARQAGKPVPDRPRNPFFRHESSAVAGLYNGKIAPLVPFALRGVVWYQGEANTHPGKGKFYGAQLRTLVTDWRAQWGEELPFAWVQLPNYGVQRDDWMLVREGMLETLALPKTGMAITVDIGDPKDIHPGNKLDVGRRLAAWALAHVYGKPVPASSGPLPAGSEIRGSEVVCRFREAEGLRDRDGGEIEGFVIAGEDSQWKPARARIEGTSVVVSAAEVPKPVAVRYAWSPNPKCDLVNAAGLPASPFRTDTWPIAAAAATKP
jgi:sialate O-acetylesterase